MAAGEKCEGMEERIARLGCAEIVEKEQNGCAVRGRVAMRVFVMAVVGLMVAGVAQAQQSGVKSGPPTPVVLSPLGACPGQLMARQHPNAEIWTVAREDRGKQDKSFAADGMGVNVVFDSAKTPVRALVVRVSYLPRRLRFMPVGPNQGMQFMRPDPKPGTRDTRESIKTFDLIHLAAMRVEDNLWVGPASTIQSVHLISATFADGSLWKASSENACSVEPSRLLPVGAK